MNFIKLNNGYSFRVLGKQNENVINIQLWLPEEYQEENDLSWISIELTKEQFVEFEKQVKEAFNK